MANPSIGDQTFERLFVAAVEKANVEDIDELPLILLKEWQRAIPKEVPMITPNKQSEYPKPDRSNFVPNAGEDETDIG